MRRGDSNKGGAHKPTRSSYRIKNSWHCIMLAARFLLLPYPIGIDENVYDYSLVIAVPKE